MLSASLLKIELTIIFREMLTNRLKSATDTTISPSADMHTVAENLQDTKKWGLAAGMDIRELNWFKTKSVTYPS